MKGDLDLNLTMPRGLEGKYHWWLNNNYYNQLAWLGPFATAKSDALITNIYQTAYLYPGARLVLVRDELANLRRTVLPDLLEKAPELIAQHDKTTTTISFLPVKGHDGVERQSVLYCFGLMTGDYKQKLKSLQPFRIYVDEGDKIYEHMYDMCVLRLRQKVYHRETGELGTNQVRIVANDEGNNWLWRKFVGKAHPGQQMSPEWAKENIGHKEDYFRPTGPQDIFSEDVVEIKGDRYRVESVDEENGKVKLVGYSNWVDWRYCLVVMERYCMYAFTHENKSLNEQNLKMARSVSTEMRDRYILGKVDTHSGLLFPEFNPNVHIVPKHDVPQSWKYVVGIDHGLEHPTAAVVMAVSDDDIITIVDEYEMAGLSIIDNATEIKHLIGNRPARFFADTQLWSRDPRMPNETLAMDYERAGVRPLYRANKSREISINKIKEYLRPEFSRVTYEEKPRLYVMEHCRKTIEALNQITWEEFQSKRNDDIVDALRYGLMGVYDRGEYRAGKKRRRNPFKISYEGARQ